MKILRVLFSACILFVLLALPTTARPSQAAAAHSSSKLSDLPIAVQGIITTALGHDDASYYAQPAERGYAASNPAQGLDVNWNEDGMTVWSGAKSWRLSLMSWGYGADQQPALVARPRADADRVDYARGALSEWYINGPLGIEQGFTLDRAPGANTAGAPLTLALAQAGDWYAVQQGSELVLRSANEIGVVRYRGLAAHDAVGRPLPAWLEVQGDQVWLQVADAGAEYPVTIDPLIQAAQLTGTDITSGSKFGSALAISGDGSTIVVGAYANGPGAAYVFVKPGGGWGNMTQTTKLTAAGGATGDRFGWSVGISNDGSTIVVGATQPNSTGAAYVFSRPLAGWSSATQTAQLTAADAALYMGFGSSIAISGDGQTVVVGAWLATIGPKIQQGAAYVFVRPGLAWSNTTSTAKLTSSNGAQEDWFGFSAAVNGNGNTVVVGAVNANRTGGALLGNGEAYVYTKPGGGWMSGTETAQLTTTDGAGGDFIGAAAAITSDGATVVIGAPAPLGHSGGAYIYTRPGLTWSSMHQSAKLVSGETGSDEFGTAVAISPDSSTIVVGAVMARLNYGGAYVFHKPGGTWTAVAPSDVLGVVKASSIGQAVGVGGGTVVVGADTTSGGVASIFTQGLSLYLPLILR